MTTLSTERGDHGVTADISVTPAARTVSDEKPLSIQNETVRIAYAKGRTVPPELAALRDLVWVREQELVPEGHAISEDDAESTHILLYVTLASGAERLVASVSYRNAEGSFYEKATNLSPEAMQRSIYMTRGTCHPDFRRCGYYALVSYLLGLAAQRAGREWIVGFIRDGDPATPALIGCRPVSAPRVEIDGAGRGTYLLAPHAVETDYMTHRCWLRTPEVLRDYLRREVFPAEIEADAMEGVERFKKSRWFDLISKVQLTKWQYERTLANLHQYVRWTTRLLGTVVGTCADKDLRTHYLSHLTGEVDHELLLEADMEHLGYDVDYVKNAMAPSNDIRLFMGLQESLAGFRSDPVIFLAVPLGIEALSAFLTPDLLGGLERNIASWGIEKPRRAMSFIASHVHTDGGDDGHWQATRDVLSRTIKDDAMLRAMRGIVKSIQTSQIRAFESYCDAFDMHHAQPQSIARPLVGATLA